MKSAMMAVVILLAPALGAQGQTQLSAIEQAAKAWVASNTVEFVLGDGGKGRRLSADVPDALVDQVVAATNADVGPSGVWVLAQGAKKGKEAAATKLEAMSDDPSLSEDMRNNADASFVNVGAGKAKLKKHLDRLGISERAARAVAEASRRLGDPKIQEEWFAAAKGKGIAIGQYRKWFLGQLRDKQAADQLFDLQAEIVGLMRSAENFDTAKPWTEELRYRMYVAKEASGQ